VPLTGVVAAWTAPVEHPRAKGCAA
jgi:hypothetical protein